MMIVWYLEAVLYMARPLISDKWDKTTQMNVLLLYALVPILFFIFGVVAMVS